MSMVKNNKYAFNGRGQKVFCRTSFAPNGVLVIDFYLPQHKFGIIWKCTDYVRIVGIRETKDKRKDIVTYIVHPSYWLGATFNDPVYRSSQDAIDMVFEEFIHLL